ncbi:MAG: hypothetical protein KAI55_04945 [Candidatus Aenigmarchaeota archaeon]|nr:hypothetical protein [Candidatus Aenigmarchaeota archaeon]
MKNKLNLEDIEKEISKIKPPSFYFIVMFLFSFMAGMSIFYAFYHDYNLIYVAVGGIWLVVAFAIYMIGYILNHYKIIIEDLIREIKNQRTKTNH